MTSRPSGTALTSVNVTVRYWASARAVAGCDSERLDVHAGVNVGVQVGGAQIGSENVGSVNVGDVLAAAAAAHTGLSVVLDVSTILLDGRAVTASEPLTEGAILEVLPPFAGG
ncbi:MAG: MoaD/ThiS family protein [Phycicoccus sp.]|nr:MoaD/ThiS family protein [Phycicoccus sp.]NMM33410.1 MoaD/ThiS family protein [Phycicoccus sp.]